MKRIKLMKMCVQGDYIKYQNKKDTSEKKSINNSNNNEI